jgi:DNA invertase Pin-like site-specific DNA recombinase
LKERIKATKQAQKARGEYSGGVACYGWRYDADKRLVPVPEQQAVIKRIRRLAAKGLSPHRISADLRERGTPLSHVTIRKVLAGRSRGTRGG